MGGLTGRIHAEPALEHFDGLVDAVLVDEKPSEPIGCLIGKPGQPRPGHEQPILVVGLANGQPVEQLAPVKREARLEVFDVVAGGETLELQRVDAAGVAVDPHRVGAARDHAVAALAKLRERLAEVVAGALLAGIPPEQRRQQLAGMRSAALDGQVGEQGPSLARGDVDGFAIGPAGLEGAQHIESKPSRHGTAL